jgi:hypothetical protein
MENLTMANSPAFQWYPKDILSSSRVAEMTLEEEGAYRRALDFCWLHGTLPNDAERLARIIGKGASTTLATVVQSMFEPAPNDPSRLIHPRLEQERQKQEIWANKSREGGLKSAETRRAKANQQKLEPKTKGGSSTLARVVDDRLTFGSNQNATLQSSSPSSSPNTPPPARAHEGWHSQEFEHQFGKPLPIYQLDLTQGKVTDRTLWAEVLSKWKSNGYSDRNITGILDFYEKETERKNAETLRPRNNDRHTGHAQSPPSEVIPFEATEGSL